jgi:uncharacterized HAD superfamily protein
MQIFDNVILTDYDGVVGLWEHGFHMWMLDNGYVYKNTGHYDIHNAYDISREEADMLVQSFNESAALRRLPPVKDAIKYVRKLHEEHGYVFHCITAIPNTRDMYNARLENIENLFGKTAFEKLILCDSSAKKKKHLEMYKDSGCYWIEDLAKNSLVGLELGLDCILMDRHYNKDFEHPEIKRVQNWKEIYEIITGKV